MLLKSLSFHQNSFKKLCHNKSMLELRGLKLRAYQEAITNSAKNKNCLVVLPTGLGKTAIAIAVAIYRLNKIKDSQVLFLAPTKPLVNQHYETFKKHVKGLDENDFALITGSIKPDKREKIWKEKRIIFSTPQCVANDLRKDRLTLENFSLLIEDEAHRCIKNYDYTYVAKVYREIAKNPLILGLTASPGSDKERIKQICSNLGIKKVEVRTRESKDVRPYLKELKIELIKVGFPTRFKEIREKLGSLLEKRIKELKNRGFLYSRATKKNLIELQKKLMAASSAGNKHFQILRAISILAEIMKVQHLLELLETQTIYTLTNYVASLELDAKEGKSKAIKKLFKNPEFRTALEGIKKLEKEGKEHPKLKVLLDIVKREITGKKKAIIFAQYRDTVDKICKELISVGITSKIFVGQKGKGGLKQKEQQKILREFSEGKIKCLISTSIGEEGLDIPEVNIVIFYEPIPSEIRKIQRAGRTARLKPGKLIILISKGTRDESAHWASYYKEKKMQRVLRSVKEEVEGANKGQLSLESFLKNG